MRKIRARTADVLAKLLENRDAHRATFEAALEGYRTQAIAAFEKNIQSARDNKPFWRYLKLECPKDHTEDYKVAIAMLEWHQGDEIELDAEAVQHFIMDNWSWTVDFVGTTSQYT